MPTLDLNFFNLCFLAPTGPNNLPEVRTYTLAQAATILDTPRPTLHSLIQNGLLDIRRERGRATVLAGQDLVGIAIALDLLKAGISRDAVRVAIWDFLLALEKNGNRLAGKYIAIGINRTMADVQPPESATITGHFTIFGAPVNDLAPLFSRYPAAVVANLEVIMAQLVKKAVSND